MQLPQYKAQKPRETALIWLSQFRNAIGLSARRKLMRVHGPRAVAEFEARLPMLGPGDICLDLGANVGLFTQKMAATGCIVHAYEPDPFAWEVLQRNVSHLPNVTLHHCAVGAVAGTFRLHRSRDFADSPLEQTVMSSIALHDPKRYQSADGIDVEVRGFREIVGAFERPVALVKMDIEGAEFDILRQIFASPSDFDIDAIYCETHERVAHHEFGEIDRMHRESATMARPLVNLYWP